MGSETDVGPFNGMWVWKLDTIPRVKTFMWQCLHNAIGVGVCLVKRCISNDDICPLCHREPETILHRLRDCGTSKQIWERLGVRQNSNFYEGNLGQWLEYNCKNNTCRLGEQPPWRIIFPFNIWLLRKHRNATIFRNLHAQPNVHKDALFRSLEFQHCGLNNKKSGSKRVVQVRWERPQVGWACLNTDGAAVGNPGRAGCGGLIRNEHGEWLGGFSRSIGCDDSFMAELWGLRDGLTLCIDLHLTVVDVQLDAKAVVQLLSNSSSANFCAMPFLNDCRNLVS